MKIFIADDYQSATPKLAAWSKLVGHDVTVCTETIKDPAKLPAGIEQAEALLLIQQKNKKNKRTRRTTRQTVSRTW